MKKEQSQGDAETSMFKNQIHTTWNTTDILASNIDFFVNYTQTTVICISIVPDDKEDEAIIVDFVGNIYI